MIAGQPIGKEHHHFAILRHRGGGNRHDLPHRQNALLIAVGVHADPHLAGHCNVTRRGNVGGDGFPIGAAIVTGQDQPFGFDKWCIGGFIAQLGNNRCIVIMRHGRCCDRQKGEGDKGWGEGAIRANKGLTHNRI